MKLSHLFIAIVVLLIFNIYMIAQHNLVYLRIARLISVIAFFTFFLLSKGKKDKTLLVAFGCFVLADVCLCFYENAYLNQLKFFFSIIGYALIVKVIYPNIIFKKINKFSLAILVVISICSLSLVISSLNMASYKLFGLFHEILFCTYGLVLTLLLLSSISYNQSQNSLYSNLVFGSAILFILADVCLVIAYYINKFDVFHIESFFYIGGLATFVVFARSYSQSVSITKIQASQKAR